MNSSGRWVTLLLIATTGAAGFFGIQYARALQRARAAEKIVHNQAFLAEYAASMQAATFIRANANTLTYGVPIQTTVDGQVFVNVEERTVRFDPVFTVFGAKFGDGPQAVGGITTGTPIRIHLRGTGADTTIDALYVSP